MLNPLDWVFLVGLFAGGDERYQRAGSLLGRLGPHGSDMLASLSHVGSLLQNHTRIPGTLTLRFQVH